MMKRMAFLLSCALLLGAASAALGWAGGTEETAVTGAVSATAIESCTWYSTTAWDGATDYTLRQEVPPFSMTTSAGSKW